MADRQCPRVCAGCGLLVDNCSCGEPEAIHLLDEIDDWGEPDPIPPNPMHVTARPKSMPWRKNPAWQTWHNWRKLERKTRTDTR